VDSEVSFHVDSSSSPAAAFQWRRNDIILTDGPNLSGATTDTLTIHAAKIEDGGSYRCFLTNNCGSAICGTAILSLLCSDGSTANALDCNQNHIPDNCDLISGIAHDCNEDEIPDECQNLPRPAIITAPRATSACVGSAASFTVLSTGMGKQ